jgi:hypothetical protein
MTTTRRLAAILAADAVARSRITAADSKTRRTPQSSVSLLLAIFARPAFANMMDRP